MRIYTEVNFQWDDKKGKLVEVSSESFDYSGEMALARSEWTAGGEYYDVYGHHWVAQYWVNMWGTITGERYKKDGEWVEEFTEGSGSRDDANDRFKKYVEGKSDGNVFVDEDALNKHWQDEYHVDRPESTTTAEEAIARYTSDEWTYAAGEWRNIEAEGLEDDPLWTEVDGEWAYTSPEEQTTAIKELILSQEYDEAYDLNDDGSVDVLDLHVLGSPEAGKTLSSDVAKASAETAIKQLIDRWEATVTPGGFDAVESVVSDYISGLKEKEKDVTTAYEDIFGAEGTIHDIEETWETAKERGKEKYTTDIGTYETEETEGLEETVVGREAELEA